MQCRHTCIAAHLGQMHGMLLDAGRPQVPVLDGSLFAWPQVPELGCCLCLLLSLFHYPFLCKQVWDGAHPVWDAFTGLCVYIKLSSTMSNKVRKKLKIKLKTKEGGRMDLRGLPPPWKKKVGFEALARAKICMPARTHNSKAYRAQLPAVVCRRSRGTACDM